MESFQFKKHLFPAINSYQGRYFYLALILISILVVVAAIGNQYVKRISSQQIERIQTRTAASTSIYKVHQVIREVDDWLRWQIIEPGHPELNILEQKLLALKQQLEIFVGLTYTRQNRNVLLSANILQQQLINLTDESIRFTHLSADIRERFPGTIIMQDEMFPITKAIMSTLNVTIHELNQNQYQHSIKNRALLSNIYRLRHNWVSLLSEFRLMVADQFSVFSDEPQVIIANRESNIRLYKEQLDADLEILENLHMTGSLFALGNGIWQDLKQNFDAWYLLFLKLRKSISADDWRRDVHLYKSQLNPLITKIRTRLGKLEQTMDLQASHDIRDLTNVARNMSRTIGLLSLLAIILAILAYRYLHSKILLPLAETTTALKKEARGETQHILPTPHLQETRDLVDAFSEMRQQVWERQQGLDHLAHHDPLTQLPNRVLLKDRLQHALKIAQHNNQLMSLMFLDLNNFKQVNDSLGHLTGDKVLKAVASRLQSAMRTSDTVARLSGDEFAILIENVSDKHEIMLHAERILNAFKRPISIDEHELGISASVGIAIAPTDDTEPNHLIRDADTAMYEAKRKGTGAYYFFSAELTKRAKKQLLLKQRLRLAVEHNEFLFHYQPLVYSSSKSLYCVESLLRWQPENDELQMPNSFLSTLMEMKIGKRLSPVMLEQLGRAQALVQEQLDIPLIISINMSASTLRNVATHQNILENFKNSSVNTTQLIIEITEDTLVNDLSTATNLLNKFKSIGTKIALDDFGTGQSSLNHLRSFPFDIIKIDREFVRDITSDPNDASLIRVITQMAHNFDMQVVAEGAETQEQYEFLLNAGCDYIQGFYISKPLPLDNLLTYIRNSASSREKS